MNTISKCTLPSWVVLGILISETAGAITVECIPIGGTHVTGGQVIEVECFVTTDVGQVFVGYVLDLACSLPGLPGSSESIEKSILWVDQFHVNPPWLFDAVFTGVEVIPPLGVVNPFTCVAGGALPGVKPGLATLPAGESAYLATIVYEIAECAAGDFAIILENFSDPPVDTDVTIFYKAYEVLIPFAFTPTTLTVVTGACCDGSTCLQDGVNAFCCAQNHPGAFFHPSQSCADSYPCRCRADVFPPGGSGLIDIDDIVCGLQGFADMASCPDADVIPCGGNGVIDIDDIVALLNAFAGMCPPCP